MSLTSGVWSRREASGALDFVLQSDIPPGDIKFNGGTPADVLGKVVAAPYASGYNTEVRVNGIGYTALGAIVTDAIGAIARYIGGIPFTANGLAVEPGGVPVRHVAGIPLASNGRVCAVQVAPVNLHGFDSGFDQGAFN